MSQTGPETSAEIADMIAEAARLDEFLQSNPLATLLATVVSIDIADRPPEQPQPPPSVSLTTSAP